MTRKPYIFLLCLVLIAAGSLTAAEKLNRGVVALPKDRGQVFVSWRLLESDPADIAFNIYRREVFSDRIEKITPSPVQNATCWLDDKLTVGDLYRYSVRPVTGGKEGEPSEEFFVRAWPFEIPYVQILLEGNYEVNNLAIADLDGDGAYDYVIKQPRFNTDPWHEPGYWKRSRDTYKIEAYNSKGKFLWRYDMGWSIETGSWYSPFILYDVDGDGRAEMYAKAGEGDSREMDGQVVTGPEYLVKVDGESGQVLKKIPWLDRKGFDTMSHVTRNMLTVAYLDGKSPSLIMQRGTYGIIKTRAMDADLQQKWYWEAAGEYENYRGQGQHGLLSADIDGDGRDELVLGSMVLSSDGKPLWTTGMGHNDVGYVADIDPTRPGLEIFYGLEKPQQKNGVCLVDAKTGKILWGYDGPTLHVHSTGMLADIDPDHPGMECYAGEQKGSQYWLYSAQGKRLSDQNMGGLAPRAAWWDGDQQKELIGRGSISKYKGDSLSKIEGQVIGIADVLGDWREEIITVLPGEIRIYSTTIPADTRRTCLMQDRQYRVGVAAASMGYYYPPQLGGNKIP